MVRSGRDLDKESQVAIKRVQDATEDLTYLRRLLREVALLRRVRGCVCVCACTCVFTCVFLLHATRMHMSYECVGQMCLHILNH